MTCTMALKCENAILLLQILLIAALCHTAAPCLDHNELDIYLNSSATGEEVVQAVVLKLYSLQIITYDDRCLLRRMALIETEDGISRKTGGGIWALDESKFKNVTSKLDKELREQLCLTVPDSMLHAYLKKPIVSGLAAALYLNYLKSNRSIRIPLHGTIEEQAQFWRTHYHSGDLTVDFFVERVVSFECMKCDAQTASQVNQIQEPLCPMTTACLNSTEKERFLKDNGNGSAVVQAVISKLHSLQILKCDRRLLRRIALVETNDGTNGVPDGGIWALSEKKFSDVASDVKKVLSNKLCLSKFGSIHYALLRKPIVSGLAAYLYLNHLEKTTSASIPLDRNIGEQAQFWMQHYHSGKLNATYFVEQVKKTREGEIL